MVSSESKSQEKCRKWGGPCRISVAASQESLVLQKGFCSSGRLVPGHAMGSLMVRSAGPTFYFFTRLPVFQLADTYFSGNLPLTFLP